MRDGSFPSICDLLGRTISQFYKITTYIISHIRDYNAAAAHPRAKLDKGYKMIW